MVTKVLLSSSLPRCSTSSHPLPTWRLQTLSWLDYNNSWWQKISNAASSWPYKFFPRQTHPGPRWRDASVLVWMATGDCFSRWRSFRQERDNNNNREEEEKMMLRNGVDVPRVYGGQVAPQSTGHKNRVVRRDDSERKMLQLMMTKNKTPPTRGWVGLAPGKSLGHAMPKVGAEDNYQR